MSSIEKRIAKLSQAAGPAPFKDVKWICDRLFGTPRIHGSHVIYKTPWEGDPQINIQNRDGKVAYYQVKQVLSAIARLEDNNG